MNKVNNMNKIESDNNNIYNETDLMEQNYRNNDNQEIENNNEEEEDEDDRLTYTLITLNLGDLIHIFEENNISFIDMLLLTKEDLKELQLSLYQRNRIYNFSLLFSKYAKNYSISEISDFFSFNKQFIFNSSIYDQVNMSLYEQNENNNFVYDENNIDNNNDNYNINFDDNKFENKNINNKKNSNTNQQNYYNGGINNNYNNNINYNNIKNNSNKKNNNLSYFNLNYPSKNNNSESDNIVQNYSINNLYYNKFDNSKKKQFKTINPNYKKETYKKYFNINNSSTMNNYLSIKKDTDDFLTKLNLQKEQSDKKRKDISKLINNQNPKKISQFKGFDQLKNMNIINNDNILQNNKDNNEEYKKMMDKIDKIEQMKMDYNSYNHLNQIKNYINSKGRNILIEDINKVNDEIDKMVEILNEKVKLKKALENCNLKINQKKQMINNIDRIEELSGENYVNVVEDEIEDNNIKIKNELNKDDDNNFENKKNVEEIVEEEYDYENENNKDSQNKQNQPKNYN